MSSLRNISGKSLNSILTKQGFILERTKGSHFIFRFPDAAEIVVVPMHPSIDRGTLSSIIKKISHAFSETELRRIFYK
jgi:predicted RNA binding protein YcfA (HicA-like mRNA interferase family)